MVTFKRSLLVFVGLMCYAVSVTANLGETMSAAKGRSASYAQRYGAVEPIFNVDSKGMVIMECWAAPPQMWSRDLALRFATELLPAPLQKAKPKALPKDGSEEGFLYPDGTRVILQEFQGKYLGVEVRSPSFKGPGC